MPSELTFDMAVTSVDLHLGVTPDLMGISRAISVTSRCAQSLDSSLSLAFRVLSPVILVVQLTLFGNSESLTCHEGGLSIAISISTSTTLFSDNGVILAEGQMTPCGTRSDIMTWNSVLSDSDGSQLLAGTAIGNLSSVDKILAIFVSQMDLGLIEPTHTLCITQSLVTEGKSQNGWNWSKVNVSNWLSIHQDILLQANPLLKLFSHILSSWQWSTNSVHFHV